MRTIAILLLILTAGLAHAADGIDVTSCTEPTNIQYWVSSAILKLEHAGDFRPLRGSDWAKANPGALPYSECTLIQHDGRENDPNASLRIGDIGLIAGTDNYSRSDVTSLFCWSQSLRLAFTIPVQITSTRSIGLTLDAAIGEGAIDIKSSSLDQKKVKDLFGRYSGTGFNLKFVAGGGVTRFKHSGVKLTAKHVGFGFSVDLSRKHLSIKPREQLSSDELHDPYSLFTSCHPRPDLGATFVDFSKIDNATFLSDRDLASRAAIENEIQSIKLIGQHIYKEFAAPELATPDARNAQ